MNAVASSVLPRSTMAVNSATSDSAGQTASDALSPVAGTASGAAGWVSTNLGMTWDSMARSSSPRPLSPD